MNTGKEAQTPPGKQFIAHRREQDGENQLLWQHLEETAALAGRFAAKIGLANHGLVMGLLHDLGKATGEFYNYLASATGLLDPDDEEFVDAAEQKGKIDHASAGAQYIYRWFADKGIRYIFLSQILPLVIASHHSGLIDCLTPDGADNFARRMRKPDEKTRLEEATANLDDTIRQKLNQLLLGDDFCDLLNQKLKTVCEQRDTKETYMFKIGLLTRFLFSCLIDADRLSTADFESPQRARQRMHGDYSTWPVLAQRLEAHLDGFKPRNEVDHLRQEISNSCLEFSRKPVGLYQLTVPTGGGKTFASLRFALNHAQEHNLERIIYIIPYTSIIDQNAQNARDALEQTPGSVVLEHHANLTPDKESTRQKLLAENWDAPLVFTTMVQFLEALFGYGTRGARRMHQLAKAVLIFDEIQTLPVKCVYLFNTAIRFLIQGLGSTVVLCTATQPLLDEVQPEQLALTITLQQQMVPDTRKLYKMLRRVEVVDRRKVPGWTEDEVAALAEEELTATGSVLIVVNTKKAALKLYQKLAGHPAAEVYHLSTGMCPAHRMDTLAKVKKCLPDQKPVLCISTQLIEAGVDIDFGSVIRYLAGLDSIAQAAGRCNRNGARAKLGRALVVNPVDENLDKLRDIKIGRDKAERVLDEFKADSARFDHDLLGPKAMRRYYQYYFHERREEMGYQVGSKSAVGREDNLFNLLALNTLSVLAYQRNGVPGPKTPLRQSFMSAAEVFKAIDAPTRGVIVPYGEHGVSLIEQLCAVPDLGRQFGLLKEAQRYAVNVFPQVFDWLVKQQIVREVQSGAGMMYLDRHYYDDQYGMSETPVREMDQLIF